MTPLGLEQVTANESKRLSRRQLLFRGVLATGGLLLFGLAVRWGGLFAAPARDRKVLTDRDEAILVALLATLFPHDAELPPADTGFLFPRLDDFLADTDPDAALLFRSMLQVIEDHAVITHGARFTRLDAATRARVVREWEMTPIYLKGLAFKSVKLFVAIPYFQQEDVRRALGWSLGCAPDHLEIESKGGVG